MVELVNLSATIDKHFRKHCLATLNRTRVSVSRSHASENANAASLFFSRKVTFTMITWQEFEQVDLRVGTVVRVEEFPEARKPAYKVTVDFGEEVGVKRTSAQITDHYSPDELLGRQVIGVVNFPPKQIGPFMSEFLLTGLHRDDGSVILAVPDQAVPNGVKLA